MRAAEQLMETPTMHIVGIELRTGNHEAQDTIPGHWHRFSEGDAFSQIPARRSEAVYAVYCNFEHEGVDNEGIYSLVVGAEVEPTTQAPEGMVKVTVPASTRRVFEVDHGRFDLVGEAWQQIWQLGDFGQSYVADFEEYSPTGEIKIFVGVVHGTTAD